MWLLLLVLLSLIILYRRYRYSLILENLTDKYVFITGCDSGFGNLLAKQLDKRGMKVLAACLTDKGAEELKKETSTRLQTIRLDVADSQSVSAAAEWVSGIVRDKGLWGLVNNAGIAAAVAPNEWLTKDDFAKILDVNILGLIDVTLKMLPMIRRARGRVVNIASVAGRISLIGGGYCISKYGVEAFSDNLRREICRFGVKVCIIEPGYFKTLICHPETNKGRLQNFWEKASDEVRRAYGQQFYENCLWGVINNAGISVPTAPNEWLTKEDFSKILNVNLLGVVDVTLKMLPLIRRARGRVVNVASIAGRFTICGGAYCMSKYGVESFSDSLRREMNPFGVKVCIIEPGFFATQVTDTKLMKESAQKAWTQAPEEIRRSYGQQYYERYCSKVDLAMSTSNTNLSLVTDCMEHALTAVHPKTRYSAGWDAKLFYLPLSYFPAMITDFLVDTQFPKPAKSA